MSISDNLALCMRNIALAAENAGRRAEDIALVGATKMNDAARVQEAISAGLAICGENRVQELVQRIAEGAYNGAQLHFIGHLQRNKAKQVVGVASLIHSVDSAALIREIDRLAAAKGIVQDILLEVNVANEAAKSGFAPDEIPAALALAGQMRAVRVRGLMAIPPICANGEENRPYFQLMQQLFIDNSEKKYDNVYMDFLSMGMSGDYTTAIDCGANMIRLGTAIFGARDYSAPDNQRGRICPSNTEH